MRAIIVGLILSFLLLVFSSITFALVVKADVIGDVDCKMLALVDYKDPVSGQIVFKKGEIINNVTGVEIIIKDDSESYCIHGGGCYPRHYNKFETFRLLNCRRTLGAAIYEGMREDVILFDLEPLGEPEILDEQK